MAHKWLKELKGIKEIHDLEDKFRVQVISKDFFLEVINLFSKS